MRRSICALALTLGASLAVTSAASAAPAVGNVSASPVDRTGGAHSDLTVSFDLTGFGPAGAGGDDLRSLRLDLPPGLIGNPLATNGTCSGEQLAADSCPASTLVGSTTAVADVVLPGLVPIDLGEQTIPGSLYNLRPLGGEAARLGIVLRPSTPGAGKVVLESPVVLRTDGGLTSTVEDIPTTSKTPAGDAQLRIDRMSLTLRGTLASGVPFLTNPSSCAPATTTVTIGTYTGQTSAAAAGFTPVGCAGLPFAPTLQASIGATREDLRPGVHPTVIVTVGQQPGEANAKTVAVALPKGLGANLPALKDPCPPATYAAGTCPASTVIGSAAAYSPLLLAPLTGAVTLVAVPGGLPQLRLALRGALSVDLVGAVGFTSTNRLINTFDNIPDVPLSRFVLTVNAGPTSPVTVDRDLCTPDQATLDGSFTAHSGVQAAATATAVRVGCDTVRAPKLTARLGRLSGGRPALRLKVSSPDRALSSVTLRLPKGLSLAKGASGRTTATAPGNGPPPKVAVRRGRLVVTAASGGAASVKVVLASKALRVTSKLRRSKAKKLSVAVDVARGGLKTIRVTAKAAIVKKP